MTNHQRTIGTFDFRWNSQKCYPGPPQLLSRTGKRRLSALPARSFSPLLWWKQLWVREAPSFDKSGTPTPVASVCLHGAHNAPRGGQDKAAARGGGRGCVARAKRAAALSSSRAGPGIRADRRARGPRHGRRVGTAEARLARPLPGRTGRWRIVLGPAGRGREAARVLLPGDHHHEWCSWCITTPS